MPQRFDQMPAKVQMLFAPLNYKFSTSEGSRRTSFYYEDGHGNQGRWRREHRDGPVLVYQGRSSRIFVRSADDFDDDVCDRLVQTARIAGTAGIVVPGEYSLAPRDGWHVIEVVPREVRKYEIGHQSSGRVILHDQSRQDLATINAYVGELSDWTMM